MLARAEARRVRLIDTTIGHGVTPADLPPR
jgi:hypothetical protein